MRKRIEQLAPKQWLVLIIALAWLLRLPVALFMGDEVTSLPGINDQISYNALAQSLLHGDGFQFDKNWYPFTPANTPTAHWSFIYPLFLAGVYLIVGYHPLAARLLQGFAAAALLCWLVYDLGRRLSGDERVGLVGAALTAVYGYFIYYHMALMTESFFMIMVLWSLKIGLDLKEVETATWRQWIGLGLIIGIGALLRQTILFFAPFLLVWIAWERWGRIRLWRLAIPLMIAGAMILPWTIRNWIVYETFLPLNSNSGYALFASTHPRLGADWRNEDIVVPVPEEYAGLNEAQLNQALSDEAIDFVLADPGRYLLLTLDKSLEYFKFWPSPTSHPLSNLVRVFSFGLYLPFMVAGLILSFSRWRAYLPLYLFYLIHTGLHLLSWPAPRYRLTPDAVVMPLAALALVSLWDWGRRRQRPSPALSEHA